MDLFKHFYSSYVFQGSFCDLRICPNMVRDLSTHRDNPIGQLLAVTKPKRLASPKWDDIMGIHIH